MTPLDLQALLSVLHAHQDPDRDNLLRLGNALVQLGAVLPLTADRSFLPAEDSKRLAQGQNMTLQTRHGALDIVQRVPGVPGFAALERDAVESDLLGVGVRVCSLHHLRATSKHAVGHRTPRIWNGCLGKRELTLPPCWTSG